MSDKHYTYGGNGSHWDGCHESHWDCRILHLERENERLRTIVDRLPTTADGVPIVPGMRVWSPTVKPCDDDGDGAFLIGRVDGKNGWLLTSLIDSVGDIYSTPEAAEASLKREVPNE